MRWTEKVRHHETSKAVLEAAESAFQEADACRPGLKAQLLFRSLRGP
jgi:hypothetical protein